jgi:hypothetical protein
MRVTYDAEVAKAYGIPAAVLLAKISYYSRYTKRKDGFCWRTAAALEAETGLSRYQQKKAAERLEAAGIIETKVLKVTGKNETAMHYRLTGSGIKETSIPGIKETSIPGIKESGISSIRELINKNNTRASGPGGEGRAAQEKEDTEDRVELCREIEEWLANKRKKAAGLEVLEGGKAE